MLGGSCVLSENRECLEARCVQKLQPLTVGESTPVQDYAKNRNDCEQPALKGPGETRSHSGLDKYLHRPGNPLVSQATKETA